jgi:glycosyltransferase involved in cell wall biosynthesis
MSGSVLKDLEKFRYKKPKILTPHPIYDHYGAVEPREKALLNLNLSKEDRYILFFGFIRDYKGLDLLLRAFSNPYFKPNRIKLIVAGEFYADEMKYRDLIKELNLEDDVILRTSYISNTEVQHYFNGADIVAQPYKSAAQSGVTKIGYHFNKPMLVTDVGGLPEIIHHMQVGYVVDPVPEEIAKALIDFFQNNRLEDFSKNILKEKERFSWDKMTKSILNLAEQIIK